MKTLLSLCSVITLVSSVTASVTMPVNAQRAGDLPCHINDGGVIVDMTHICGIKVSGSGISSAMTKYAEDMAKLATIVDPFEKAVKEAEANAELALSYDLYYMQNGMGDTGDGKRKFKIYECLKDFYEEGGSLAQAKSSCGAY